MISSPMRVQTHARLPLDPLATLEEDYENAVIHVAWNRSETGVRTLLFAFVELLPVELPPPPDDGEQSGRMGAGHELLLRRLVLSAQESLAWYLDCRRGSFALPDEGGALTSVDVQGVDVVLGEEPAWPSLVCVNDGRVIPFCPDDLGQPRVHHLIARAAFPLDTLWPERGFVEKAVQWLTERLHFSLTEYPEYWGSVHLVAPNPVYRGMDVRSLSTTAGDSVLVRFEPRAGRSLDDLEFILIEQEPWGILDLRHIVVKNEVIRVDFGRTVTQVKEEVFDPRRGVLSGMHEAYPFLRSIRVEVSIGTRQPPREAPYVASAAERMRQGYRERKSQAEARQRLELFEGRSSGFEVLREHASLATRDVLVVDPELRAVSEFIDELDLHGASYRFLTAANGAESETRLDQLRREIDELEAQKRSPSVDLRVSTGTSTKLEGTFVVFDGRVWMANASLHRLGERGTLMLAAPHAASLREFLDRTWDDARSLTRSENGP